MILRRCETENFQLVEFKTNRWALWDEKTKTMFALAEKIENDLAGTDDPADVCAKYWDHYGYEQTVELKQLIREFRKIIAQKSNAIAV